MSDAKHTATPWAQNVNKYDLLNRIEGPDGTAVLLPGIFVGSKGELVCTLESEWCQEIFNADLAFLQLAVNCHDELVGALGRCRDLIESWMDGPVMRNAGVEWKDPEKHPPALIEARAILAKVESGGMLK